MSTDLQTLADLVSATDQWEQAGAPPQDLLQQGLPLIRALLPTARGLRLWLAAAGGLQVVGAAGDLPKGKPQVPAGEMLQASRPRYDKLAARWTVPLRREDRLLGALEIMTEEDAERDPQSALALRMVGNLWTSALEKRAVVEQAQRRATISAALTGSQSFYEISEVLAGHLLRSGQRLLISLVRHDDQQNFIGLHTVTAASRSQAHKLNHEIDMRIHEVGQTMRRALEDGEIVLSNDVQADPGINDRFKLWREGQPIVATCMIPLRSQGRVLGLLSLNTLDGPLDYTEFEWRLLHTLADQIGGMTYGLLLARQAQQNVRSLQRLAQSRALVNQITGQMQQETDIASILDLTVSELGQALGARRARIRLARPASVPQPAASPTPPENEAER